MTQRQILVANARTALRLALGALRKSRGAKICLPDFVCDVLLHPLDDLGWLPLFYPVTDDLAPDWTALDEMVVRHGPRALVMVHYFGQPQDVGRFGSFSRQHGLFLIDNNAHGYGGTLHGRALGSLGDTGISSPRKLLGTPSGGVLYADENLVRSSLDLNPHPLTAPGTLLRMALSVMPKAKRWLRGQFDRRKNWNDARLFRESVKPYEGIDWFSRRRMLSANWPAIAEERRDRWRAWCDFARGRGLRPVFGQIDPESCPWAMPAYARDLADRNRWLQWGAENRVPLFPWPSLPEQIILEDGTALARWRRLVCFPLDLAPSDAGL